MAQYNQDCSQAWKNLTHHEKAKLSSEAKALNSVPVHDLPSELRPERQHRILSELAVIEKTVIEKQVSNQYLIALTSAELELE